MRRLRGRGITLAVAVAAMVVPTLGPSASRDAPTRPAAMRPSAAPLPKARERERKQAATFTSAQRAQLTHSLDRYLKGRQGALSVSVRELSTGLGYAYDADLRTATASIVKVDIVMALLLQAQKDGRALTSTEKALAERAIKVSDNGAATALWHAIGRSDGLAAANRRFGLRTTTPGPGDAWGSTTTSAADQIRLLNALTSSRSPLSAANRRYVRHLMEDVTPEQTWGVSAAQDTAAQSAAGAAAAGAVVGLKNGWLPRQVHGGAWTINSIGLVRRSGRLFAVAAVSERHPSMRDGIAAVEHACRAAVTALARALPPASGAASDR
ncbi:serine hydrolase [Actinomadura fibrosa]|uniref:Serine hydrolase n=1 Tax=Actinomadura fibrosa TaxID=111802 RepID=A0ABW2XH78_9ACTN|nr:serine hydrolase [Actinomadura fibrosa]